MPVASKALGESVTAMVARISQRDYRVGIVGLGYVGVPLVLAATRKGFRVLGFDIDAARVAGLNRGETGIRHMDNAAVARAVADGSFEATADFTRLCEPDAILIAVPTPLTRQREPRRTIPTSNNSLRLR